MGKKATRKPEQEKLEKEDEEVATKASDVVRAPGVKVTHTSSSSDYFRLDSDGESSESESGSGSGSDNDSDNDSGSNSDSDSSKSDVKVTQRRSKIGKEDSSSSSSSDSENEDENSTEKEAKDTKELKKEAKENISSSSSDTDDLIKSTSEVTDVKMDDTEDDNPKKRKSASEEDSPPSKKVAVQDPSVNTTMHIRQLPWRSTYDEVYEYFKGCGKILSLELPVMNDGRSSGTAIIKFETNEECKKCLELDKADFNGRRLKIDHATAKAIAASRKSKELSEKPKDCRTIFVGNLVYDIDENTLRDVFKDCGEIAQIRFATERETSAFKCFVYIEFIKTESVDEAIKLRGRMLMGRPMNIDYAPDKSRNDGVSRKNLKGCKSVFIGNLSYQNEETVKDFFKDCGEIANIRFATDQKFGTFRGFGHVEFTNAESVDEAVKLSGKELMGKYLNVQFSSNRSESGDRQAKPKNVKSNDLGEKPEGCKAIFVANLGKKMSEDTLKDFFKDCGEMSRICLGTDKITGKLKGFAHIDFVNTECVDKAVKLKGRRLMDRSIKINYGVKRIKSGSEGGGRGGKGGAGRRRSTK